MCPVRHIGLIMQPVIFNKLRHTHPSFFQKAPMGHLLMYKTLSAQPTWPLFHIPLTLSHIWNFGTQFIQPNPITIIHPPSVDTYTILSPLPDHPWILNLHR